MDDYDEIIKEYLVEASEHLDRMDNDFVAIEQNPTDPQLISSIFRSIHTIKGGSGFFSFSKLEKLTHTAESLLSLVRDGKLALDSEMTSALLEAVDAVRKMIEAISETAHDGDNDYATLISTLEDLQKTPGKLLKPAIEKSPVPECSEEAPIAPDAIQDALQNLASMAPATKPDADKSATLLPTPIDSMKDSTNAPTVVAETAIRVDVSLLDSLMNMAGELVLARNHVLQYSERLDDSGFQASIHRINQITTDLREGIMKTRMQQIGGVWTKFPRIVRDLAKTLNKLIALEMVGEKTELDKSLLEAIRDPLTHLIRNSVDHGIESPEVRKVNGKNPEGKLTLRAYHEGGQVNIEMTDDGGGIDANKIFRKAVEKKLVSADLADKMTEREKLNLIFLPGFSMAEKVTNVSGRGVGMDVVKTNIEKIGGSIDITSKVNEGTVIKLKIPLTLAIIPALIIECSNNGYAIPQLNVVELLRLNEGSLSSSIEMFQNVPVLRLRGNLLPIVYLPKLLGNKKEEKENSHRGLNVVVLQADGQHFGLVVDKIINTQEIVVKPLTHKLKKIPIFAGATMMGDGTISLILDVMNMALAAHATGKNKDRNGTVTDSSLIHNEKIESLLMIKSRDDGRFVIPLSAVARLEEFTIEKTENIGGKTVVQYREKIMPLVSILSLLPERRSVSREEVATHQKSQKKNLQVIVCEKNSYYIGFIVPKILDIIHQEITFDNKVCREGVAGTMIVQGRVTEILDMEHLMVMALKYLSDTNFSDQKLEDNNTAGENEAVL